MILKIILFLFLLFLAFLFSIFFFPKQVLSVLKFFIKGTEKKAQRKDIIIEKKQTGYEKFSEYEILDEKVNDENADNKAKTD